MSEPQDHSRSGFDPSGPARSDPSEEARRFWGEYVRSTRGGHREPRAENGEHSNGHAATGSHECLDWCPICRGADVLRATAPPELRGQLQNLQRDALVTMRALLDAYIERSESAGGREGVRVEDIPID
jgi:hypothetical protein